MSGEVQTPTIRKDGLQLEENRDFQRKFWRVERVAWLLFAVVVAAALAGFSGGRGFFGRQSVAAGSLVADLPTVSRWQGSEQITLELGGGEGSRTVLFGGEFGKHFVIERTQPEPQRSRAASAGLEMEFAGSEEGPSRVVIELIPSRPGFASVILAAGGARATAGILVLP